MWIVKFMVRHDCILANRCRKFQVILQGVNFSTSRDAKGTVTASMHYMTGDRKALDRFVTDLKCDPAVIKLERKGNTFFLVEKGKSKAVAFHSPRILFIKPVLTGIDAWEHWEVASWERQELSRFVMRVKHAMPEFKLLKFVRTPIDTVYFPRLMPDLSPQQRRALELAIEFGYFSVPRGSDLRTLAKAMGVSLATFQEHLSRAQAKMVPSMVAYRTRK